MGGMSDNSNQRKKGGAAMGYYDDHYPSRKRKSKGSIFLGIILGAALVIGIVSIGQMMNIGGSSAAQDEEQNDQEEDFFAEDSETVHLDVTTDVTDVVDNVSDSVVGVFNLQNTSFWGGAGGVENEEGVEAGTGSGVIYKVEGDLAYVVTNEHVIQGSDELEVSLSEGQRVPAELVAQIFGPTSPCLRLTLRMWIPSLTLETPINCVLGSLRLL